MELSRNSTFQPEVKNYVELQPTKAVLIKMTDQHFYEGIIKLTNITNQYIIYKFILPTNSIYCITPSIYFIKPHESCFINFKRFEMVNKQMKFSKLWILILKILLI